MLQKHRSLRGSLASNVKKAIFAVFGENMLPPINTNATAAEIHQWKSTASVRNCYNSLFQTIPGSDIAYVTRITERVWPDPTKRTNPQVAYAVSICQTLLDPNNEIIKIKEKIIKHKLHLNLVSFAIFYK